MCDALALACLTALLANLSKELATALQRLKQLQRILEGGQLCTTDPQSLLPPQSPVEATAARTSHQWHWHLAAPAVWLSH